jgi:nicotinamidase-related amidase
MSQNTREQKKSETALLIIDVQNGVFGGEGETFNGEDPLNNLEYLIEKARESEIPVIFVQHNTGVGQNLEPHTDGWQIHPRLNPKVGDLKIQKSHPDSFHDINLLD